MIPKVIHYCWFGGAPLPQDAIRCINSWKKVCPDYKIVQWNEKNFDVKINQYCLEAYRQKKWAFVSDVARLKIIYDNGGIYLDTDVELLKSLDNLLYYKGYMGMESTGSVNTGLGFGAEKHLPLLKELLNTYDNCMFDLENLVSCPVITTELLERLGFISNGKIQDIADIRIFPVEYFAPINLTTRKKIITTNTYSIHHYSASWASKEHKKDIIIRKHCCRIFGDNIGMKAYGHFAAIRSEGIYCYFKRRILRIFERK